MVSVKPVVRFSLVHVPVAADGSARRAASRPSLCAKLDAQCDKLVNDYRRPTVDNSCDVRRRSGRRAVANFFESRVYTYV